MMGEKQYFTAEKIIEITHVKWNSWLYWAFDKTLAFFKNTFKQNLPIYFSL